MVAGWQTSLSDSKVLPADGRYIPSPCRGAPRAELEAQLGRVEDQALLHAVERQQALLRWQQQLNPKGQLAAAASQGKPGAASVPQPVPLAVDMSADDAVLVVCGVGAEVAAAAYAAAAGSGDGGAAAAAAAAFTAALAPKPPPRVASAAQEAAVEADVFGAKGRVLNAEAGARWLVSWCSRVTGGATSGDDTVPTAVCRLLLSGAWRGGGQAPRDACSVAVHRSAPAGCPPSVLTISRGLRCRLPPPSPSGCTLSTCLR